ncbi:MAG: flagellar hook-length control protein FliK [Lachnospiraceae bacterium]|nr:flagellar hook-length control protein FliK [Lachnospiraceae bacterium]
MTKNVSVMNLTASSAGEVQLPQQNSISDLQTATYDAAKKVPQSDANARPDANKFASMTDEKQALRDFADKTNAVLEETLDVTEEEIVAAMENLGLCYMDLLDPNNLTKLVSELSLEESVSLLVTNTVTDILDQVQTLGSELLSSVYADVATLKNVELFADGFAPVTDEEVPVTIGDINQTTENEEILPQMTSNEVLPQEIAKPTDASHEDALQVAEVVILPEEEEAHITKPNTDSTNQTVDMTNDVAEEAEGGLQEILQKSGSDASENGNTNSQYNRKNETPVGNDHLVRSSEQNLATSFTTTTQVVGESVEQVTTYSYGIDTRDVIEQIVSNAKVTISNQVTSMEMELNPQNLCRMILNVAENDGKVTAHITLQNEAVRHAMESQMAVLKENLNQQGIKVEAVEVSVGTHEFERNLEEGQMQQSNQQTEDHAASQTRRTNINLNQMDDMDEMLSEAEALVASMMKDAGNSVNFTA